MTKYLFYFLFLLGLAHHTAYCQEPAYFRSDSTGLNLDANSLFDNAGCYIVGELHDARITPEIKLAFIKYLHERKGVNDVFMEVGHAAAYLYNSYLNTGDTAFITHPSLVYASNADGMSFWKRLYEYNSTTGFAIAIHGFDFERMEFVKVLRLLKPAGKNVPDQLKAVVHYLDTINIARVNGHNLVNSYARTRHQFQLFKGDFSSYYGDDFSIADEIMANENTYEAYKARNENMYAEVQKQVSRSKMTSFLLFAGAAHCNKMDKTSLASRLTVVPVIPKKMLVIAMLCKNCDGIHLNDNDVHHFSGPKEYCKDKAALDATFRRLKLSKFHAGIISVAKTGFSAENGVDLLIIADK